MQPHELKLFSDAMTGTFEAFGARPLSPAGIEQWFRTLREFPLGHVLSALDGWVREHNKAPTAAQIRDACYERAIREREKETDKWREEERLVERTMGATPGGRKALAMIRAGLARPKGDPLDWARVIVDRHERGEQVGYAQLKMAREALGWFDRREAA